MSTLEKVPGIDLDELAHLVRIARERELLVNLDEQRHTAAAVFLACVDGKWFGDTFDHARRRGALRPHTVTVAGGAMILDPYFEYPEGLMTEFGFQSARYIRPHVIGMIRHGLQHMACMTLITQGHVVCGVAQALVYNFLQSIGSLLRGYAYARETFLDVDVRPTIHVGLHQEGGCGKTFQINVPEWQRRYPQLFEDPRSVSADSMLLR